MTQQLSPLEQYERLGANPRTAEELLARGISPLDLLERDHPHPAAFLTDRDLLVLEDIDELILLRYPAFDPSIFERLLQSGWTFPEWFRDPFWAFGPLIRICDLGEAGIHPMVVDDVSWEFESGAAIVDRLDDVLRNLPEPAPVNVVMEDVEFSITTEGVERNAATEAELAFVALSGEPILAIRLLNTWTKATRAQWPTHFPWEAFTQQDIAHLLASSNPQEPHPEQHLSQIWRQTMLRRLRHIAPTIPDWETAFAEEHPEWASHQ